MSVLKIAIQKSGRLSENSKNLFSFVNERIYSGIKTGHNDSFILDNEKFEKLNKTEDEQ
jgi:ATP phosphoribosyltransferase